ncbi:hypothetical protein [Paenibacillus sp. F4]|uniref:hypothetical protein n=1 Tax=Paenibacillus sp. F4 TaxID=357385 RepID=UPI0015E09A87|nr:hypothetical protein [Paenibacillus sp. F4]
MLVQALIQQRFYVDADRRFYERSPRISEHSGFACCAHVLRCARIRWLKASLLEPARSREGRGLFATQIRQPSRARGLR